MLKVQEKLKSGNVLCDKSENQKNRLYDVRDLAEEVIPVHIQSLLNKSVIMINITLKRVTCLLTVYLRICDKLYIEIISVET